MLGGRFLFGDSESYWTLARAIAFGEPYRYGNAQVFRTPGYPLALAPLFWIYAGDPPHLLARLQAAFFGVLAVWGVWKIAREVFGSKAALISAGIAAVYPGAGALSILILSEALFCPVMVFHLYFAIAAWKAASPPKSALLSLIAGIFAGLGALTRPSWILFPLFIGLVGIVVYRGRLRQLTLLIFTIGGMILVLSPWWIRNYCVTGRFVATSLQTGASLYDGLNPQATGASNMEVVDRRSAEIAAQLQLGDTFGQELNARNSTRRLAEAEVLLNDRLITEAVQWALEHPVSALRLAVIKFQRMWSLRPNMPELARSPIGIVWGVIFLPILLAGLWGTVKFSRLGWPILALWLPAVYFTLIHMIFVSSIRYREPAMLPWLVLIGGTLSEVLRGCQRARTPVNMEAPCEVKD